MIDRLNAACEGRYQIVREVGEGGMATVFLADDLRQERQVAHTVFEPDLATVGRGRSSTRSRSRTGLLAPAF